MNRPGDIDDLEVRDQLRRLRVDPPEGDFAASLHRRLAEAGAPEKPRWWQQLRSPSGARLLWPALGVAAGLAVFFALHGTPGAPKPPPAAVASAATSVVPSTKVAVVQLNLTAEVAVASADIRITLPEGLAFWSDGEALAQNSFEWNQPLAAGDNVIPIAVRGQKPGRYQMKVSAKIGTERVEHEVVLEVTDG